MDKIIELKKEHLKPEGLHDFISSRCSFFCLIFCVFHSSLYLLYIHCLYLPPPSVFTPSIPPASIFPIAFSLFSQWISSKLFLKPPILYSPSQLFSFNFFLVCGFESPPPLSRVSLRMIRNIKIPPFLFNLHPFVFGQFLSNNYTITLSL